MKSYCFAPYQYSFVLILMDLVRAGVAILPAGNRTYLPAACSSLYMRSAASMISRPSALSHASRRRSSNAGGFSEEPTAMASVHVPRRSAPRSTLAPTIAPSSTPVGWPPAGTDRSWHARNENLLPRAPDRGARVDLLCRRAASPAAKPPESASELSSWQLHCFPGVWSQYESSGPRRPRKLAHTNAKRDTHGCGHRGSRSPNMNAWILVLVFHVRHL